jgi:hypothetical protein
VGGHKAVITPFRWLILAVLLAALTVSAWVYSSAPSLSSWFIGYSGHLVRTSALSGEAHVRNLEECLRRRSDPRTWAAALDTLVLVAYDGFAGRRGRMLDSTGATPVHEALLEVPGAYDCEVVGAAVRCLFFEAPRSGAAAGRYRKLSKILKSWLPPGWSSAEQISEDRERRRVWIARDRQTHTLLTLTLSGTQVYLLVKRLPV